MSRREREIREDEEEAIARVGAGESSADDGRPQDGPTYGGTSLSASADPGESPQSESPPLLPVWWPLGVAAYLFATFGLGIGLGFLLRAIFG